MSDEAGEPQTSGRSKVEKFLITCSLINGLLCIYFYFTLALVYFGLFCIFSGVGIISTVFKIRHGVIVYCAGALACFVWLVVDVSKEVKAGDILPGVLHTFMAGLEGAVMLVSFYNWWDTRDKVGFQSRYKQHQDEEAAEGLAAESEPKPSGGKYGSSRDV